MQPVDIHQPLVKVASLCPHTPCCLQHLMLWPCASLMCLLLCTESYGDAGTPRHDPFAPPTPSQVQQERHTFPSGWQSQVPRRLDSSHSINLQPPDQAAHSTFSSIAHAPGKDSRSGKPDPSLRAEEQKFQDCATQQVSHSGPARLVKQGEWSPSVPQATQASEVRQQPGRRLGPMQAAKLALSRSCPESPAAHIIPRRQSCPSSESDVTAQPAAKRAKLAGAVERRIQAATTSEHAQQMHLGARSRICAGDVCAKCEKPIPLSATTCADAWACRGACRQSFHSACAPPKAALTCFECMGGMRVCFFCKRLTRAGELTQCAMAGCGRFYHPQCAARYVDTLLMCGD